MKNQRPSDNVGSNDDICVYWGEFGQDTERYDAYVAAQPWWWRLWHRYVNEWPLRRRFQRQLDRESSAEVVAIAELELSMQSTKALQEAYGFRFEDVILNSGDRREQLAAMDAMAAAAESAGLIDSSSWPPRSDLAKFLSYLWNDNPAVRDRLNLRREFLPKPSALKELSDVLAVLQ